MEYSNHIINTKDFDKINKVIEAKKLSHCHLILSPDENYNHEFCKAFALKLVCDFQKPCFQCDNCKKMLSGFHPDVLIYPKEKTFLVADSNSIIENVMIKPMNATYKVIIINNFDKSTVQAQNKLLKVLEEAPKNVIFIMNSTDANNILPTIKSRAQTLNLQALSFDEIQKMLSSKFGTIANKILKLGDGWLSKTISYLEGDALENYNFVLKLLKEMISNKKVLEFAPTFSKKEVFLANLNLLQELMEDILYFNTNLGENEDVKDFACEFSLEAIYEIFNLISLAKKQFKANVSTNLITDVLLFKFLEVKFIYGNKKSRD